MSTSICWELTCDGLVSRPGGVKESHPLNTTETGDKRRPHGPLGSYKDLAFLASSLIFGWAIAHAARPLPTALLYIVWYSKVYVIRTLYSKIEAEFTYDLHRFYSYICIV